MPSVTSKDGTLSFERRTPTASSMSSPASSPTCFEARVDFDRYSRDASSPGRAKNQPTATV